jgi:hypothetical protein
MRNVPRSVNVEQASVSLARVTTTSGISAASIRVAFSRVPALRCYRDTLRSHGAAAAGTATLRLKIDVTGYVTGATLDDAQFLPGLKGCIEPAAKMIRVKDVDTGEATADLTLVFASPP